MMTDDQVIDLDAIAARLTLTHGLRATVEQTGGGTATLYVGKPTEDADGIERYAAIAGPGWFDGPAWSMPRAHLEELSAALDDDGESGSDVWPLEVGAVTVPAIAALIAALATKGAPLSLEDVEALGLDGSGRGMAP